MPSSRLEPATMPGRVVIEWDKEDCADLGLIKVDLLGLGMMAVLEESLELIRDHYPEPVDLAHLPQDDPKVYAALAEGRHHRHVPGGEPRADVLPAAPQTQKVLRHRGAGGHHPSGPDRRQDAAPVFEPAAGIRRGRMPASVAGTGVEADPGRPAVPGTVAEDRHDRGQLHRRRGRGAAPRHGLQAQRGSHARHRDQAAQRHDGERHPGRDAGSHRAIDHFFRTVRIS